MPFNGAGVYSPPGANFPAVANTLILSNDYNTVVNDLATALSGCITKDGQTVVTANIPMAGFKLTGLGAANAAGQSLRYEQALLLAGVAGAVAPSYLGGTVYPFHSGLIFGLTLSTAGASTTMSIAPGVAADPSTAAPYLMRLASALAKTTAAWAVGNAQGGLDTGAIANSTWYHFYLVSRPDTGVVDVLFSTSATAPTMPANYTVKRRIGSGLTNGSGQWVSFTQDGDYFIWAATVLDINSNNPGTAAVLRTLSVPLGVNVEAHIQAGVQNTAAAGITGGYFSDPAQNDEVPSHGAGTSLIDTPEVFQGAGAVRYAFSRMRIRTNTSSQIRSRIVFSDASCYVVIRTLGWIDTRGRNS